jgi:uncharacterized repeat protein (TIGR03803 family)
MFKQGFRAGAALTALLAALAAAPADASTLETLYTFTGGDDGADPFGRLAYSNGFLYGTASEGNGGPGTIFAFDLETREFGTVYGFSGGADGASPYAGVIVSKGRLYGTTHIGGSEDYPDGSGTLYTLDLQSGDLTTLHTFTGGADGGLPGGDLILRKGVLDGTTALGGVDGCTKDVGCGTAYSFDTGHDEFTSLYQLPADGTQGWNPFAGLTSKKGVLYGTASTAGIIDGELAYGTVFALSGGKLDVLHTFDGNDGASPQSSMVYRKGMLYGATNSGTGCNDGCGTLFQINAKTGAFTTLHVFNGTDGNGPRGALLFKKGKLYGTTLGGGTGDCNNGCGTVYEFDIKTGVLKTLYDFSGGADGWNPFGGVIFVKGKLYGTTAIGGSGFGTIFSLTP